MTEVLEVGGAIEILWMVRRGVVKIDHEIG